MNKEGNHIIALIIGSLLLIFVTVLMINKYYLSKVIISGPLSISVEGIPSGEQKALKIYGYSPKGKMQAISHINELNTWEYFDYSSFRSLCIFLPDSVGIFTKIVITTKNNRIEISDLENKISNNTIDLSEFIKGKISKTEIVSSIFHWKEFKYLLIFLLALIILILIFLKIKNKKAKYSLFIFWSFFVLGLMIHLSFLVITKKYLISSGIFLILFISLLAYAILRVMGKTFKLKLKIKEIRLTIITVAICLCGLESFFILTGYNSTYLEKRFHYYYTSGYIPEKTGWFRVWNSDHDLKTKEYCYHRSINSEGLSDKEHPVKKDTNEYRIIGLGDSFTEGDGTDTDSTWMKFLERSLSKYSLKKKLTYMNAGVCGSDPYFEYILLKERMLKYKSDLVLLAVNNSDISDILLRGGMERFRPDGTLKYNPAPWWEPIYAMSHISRLFFAALGYNQLLLKENETNFNVAKEKIFQILLTFKELSERKQFKLIVIFHPAKNEINDNIMGLGNVMERISNDKVEVLNMCGYFREKEKINSTNSNEYFWKYDGHHNAKGYAAFARGVEWKLKQSGIMDSLIQK